MHPNKCLYCGSCVQICPQNALSLREAILEYIQERCSLCLQCVDACPAEAIELAGKRMTPIEVTEEVIKDKVFFNQSGGGVTVSGGEPLAQPDFLLALLKTLKNKSIHTAVDTSGYSKWDVLERVSAVTDLFLFDLKVVDSALSKKVTGKFNAVILENLHKLAQIHRNIHIRIPLIPTVNDDPESIESIGRYFQDLGIKDVSIHPYHNLGVTKYKKIGWGYKLDQIKPPAAEKVAGVRSCLERYGLMVT